MAKITDPDDLNVGTEITIDTSAKTFTLVDAGNLDPKEGVTIQAVYSKFVDLWTSSTYNKYPFPMYTIDAKSGQFEFGTDGGSFNGWKPADNTTRQMLRDGGWSEYSNAGVLNRMYVGIVQLGSINTGAQVYYQRAIGGSAIDFTFDDEVNEGVQVFGDASNGNFDNRTYFKMFVREEAKIYDDVTITDVGEAGTGAYKIAMPLSNADDLKIQDTDANVAANAPYTGITTTWIVGNGFTNATVTTLVADDVRKDTAGRWFICTVGGTVDAAGVADYTNNGGSATLAAYTGEREIGGVYRAFNIIVDGNSASAEDIYTKVQYLLRQATDIDAGAGTVTGKTANALLYFVGDTLYTTQGVYIDDYDANDINRLVFTDSTNTERTEPYTSTGNLNFNSYLTSGGTGYYRMYFTDLAGDYDYGKTDAITVNDKDGSPIQGTISGGTISFTFDYDGNSQGSRTPGTDADITVVAGNPGSAKPVVVTYTITRATNQGVTLTAEQDRAYLV